MMCEEKERERERERKSETGKERERERKRERQGKRVSSSSVWCRVAETDSHQSLLEQTRESLPRTVLWDELDGTSFPPERKLSEELHRGGWGEAKACENGIRLE